MTVGRSRRFVLLGLLAHGLGACAGSAASTTSTSVLPWPSPQAGEGGLVALMAAGLSATDLLLAISAGEAPNAALMRERGLFVEGIDVPAGLILTEEELGQSLLRGWSRDAAVAPCLRWRERLPEPSVAGNCPGELAERWQGMVASALDAVGAGSHAVLIADDALLTILESTLIADERQSGFSAASAAASAQSVRVAVKALDAALGALLRQLDLANWAVALVSDSEAWPVFSTLDPAAAGVSAMRLYDGGAILETDAAVAVPVQGAWAEVTTGSGPDGRAAFRLAAPAGHVFASPGATIARATPRARGFLVAVGAGVSEGTRLPLSEPALLAQFLGQLAGHQSAPPT